MRFKLWMEIDRADSTDWIFLLPSNLLVEINHNPEALSQSAITCSKLTIETLEQGVKYVQS